MPFYAHKSETKYHLLSVHLAEVAAGATARLATGPDSALLAPAAWVAGLAHDFGKYTGFFQRYLKTGRGGPEKQHALLSALWAAHLSFALVPAPPLPLAVFLAVCRHHRHLSDPDENLIPSRELSAPREELEPPRAAALQLLEKQAADLKGKVAAINCSLAAADRHSRRLLARNRVNPPKLSPDWTALLADFLQKWPETYGRLYREHRHFQRHADPELRRYFNLLSLFSALIDADKLHAARVRDTRRRALPLGAANLFRKRTFGPPRTTMETLRDDLYRTVCRQVEQAGLEEKIFTVTAPTGAGKTLAGMAAALGLRRRLRRQGAEPPRIIYALPFTSIVDQTFTTGQAVLLSALNRGALDSSLLLKHHHLVDLTWHRAEGEREPSLDEALMLIESWQSEMVITTFVQLLHTLISAENGMLKKMHRLRNAVVLLDEVQNIPVEYWPLVETALKQAARHLDMRIILMTATQPAWFKDHSVRELAGDPAQVEERFTRLNRVTVSASLEPKTVEELAQEFLWQYQRGKSYLAVLNTIQSSIDFFRLLKEAWSSQGPPLYYLSTNIVPAQRASRLQRIKEALERGEKPVLVSTQVVEAGVDLDFDEVWRDLGPVDAVVQVSGRCNRHCRRDTGNVRVRQLVSRTDKGDRFMAPSVYGAVHIHAARKLFQEHPTVSEPDFYTLTSRYFNFVRQAKSTEESKLLLEAMSRWHFSWRQKESGSLGVSNFALIKEQPHCVNVFVALDEKAQSVWEQYRSTVAGEKDLRRRRQAFLKIKHDFLSYILTLPGKLVLPLEPDSVPLCLPPHLVPELYDADTGFKRSGSEQDFIF